jgi:hypothetical protein
MRTSAARELQKIDKIVMLSSFVFIKNILVSKGS